MEPPSTPRTKARKETYAKYCPNFPPPSIAETDEVIPAGDLGHTFVMEKSKPEAHDLWLAFVSKVYHPENFMPFGRVLGCEVTPGENLGDPYKRVLKYTDGNEMVELIYVNRPKGEMRFVEIVEDAAGDDEPIYALHEYVNVMTSKPLGFKFQKRKKDTEEEVKMDIPYEDCELEVQTVIGLAKKASDNDRDRKGSMVRASIAYRGQRGRSSIHRAGP